MTIAATASEKSYAGNGVSIAFPIPFVFDTSADIRVVSTSAAGVPTILSTGFSITGGGGSTGTCTFSVAPAVNTTITILDDPEQTQTADYIANDSFSAETHERALDRSVRLIKRLNQRVGRSLRVADGDLSSGDSLLLPVVSTRQGKFLAFDASGNPTVASGTGNDSALRTDLAITTAGVDGSRLSGYRRNASGSVARSVGSKADDIFNGADFGMVADGATDNSLAFTNAMNAAAGKGTLIIQGGGTYRFVSQVAVPSNLRMEIQCGALLDFVTDNTPFMKGQGVSNVEIYGLGQVRGVQATVDWPSPSSNADGLIMFTNNGGTRSSNIRIHGIQVTRAWCLISGIRTDGLWVENNVCSNFYRYGILASQSTDFHITNNNVVTCNATVTVAYGIMATGDVAGGNAQKRCTISLNSVKDVPSWDAIMTHEVQKLSVIGNNCENVRNGLDIGAFSAANSITDVTLIGNTIDLTTTNTWGATPAAHFGIAAAGVLGSQAQRVTIIGNTINNFGQMAGSTYAGDPCPISIEYISNFTCVGNTIGNAENNSGDCPGIQFVGAITNGVCTGNCIEGDLPNGSIRLNSVSSGLLTIQGNTCKQTTPANNAVVVTGSTVSLALTMGATNSTAPFSQGTSTITWVGDELEGTATYDPPSLVDGAGATTTVTVTGAALGDYVMGLSFGGDTAGITITGWVSAANTVSVRFQNETGGTLDVGSSTLRALVRRRH